MYRQDCKGLPTIYENTRTVNFIFRDQNEGWSGIYDMKVFLLTQRDKMVNLVAKNLLHS